MQVWAGGWDHHEDIEDRLPASAAEIDKPAAALLTDLKQRGLLDSTLVIWGGEFGRTVTRDRNGNDNPGPRSQQQGVQPLARRRRREGRHGLRRDR